MAALVETAVKNGIDSFLALDSEKARQVIGNDHEINTIEMDIDSDTVACLVLNAPVAGDFRILFCIQKMNKDLERIGDHAVNIAESTMNCSGYSNTFDRGNVEVMASHAIAMYRDAIECFKNSDPQLAILVLKRDDQVDELNRQITRQVIEMVKNDVTGVEVLLQLLRVSKNLERIADLATNIAEDVIFYVKALDVKHHHLDE
jgi:phosphate transport system protein